MSWGKSHCSLKRKTCIIHVNLAGTQKEHIVSLCLIDEIRRVLSTGRAEGIRCPLKSQAGDHAPDHFPSLGFPAYADAPSLLHVQSLCDSDSYLCDCNPTSLMITVPTQNSKERQCLSKETNQTPNTKGNLTIAFHTP